MAPAATRAGTLSAAGEALHRLPPADARPWIWVEPMRLIASTTPGHAFLSFLCSPITAAGVAAPMVKPPLVSLMDTMSAIFLTSTITPGACVPAFIWTRRSVPPARIRPLPLAAAISLTAWPTVFAALYWTSFIPLPRLDLAVGPYPSGLHAQEQAAVRLFARESPHGKRERSAHRSGEAAVQRLSELSMTALRAS